MDDDSFVRLLVLWCCVKPGLTLHHGDRQQRNGHVQSAHCAMRKRDGGTCQEHRLADNDLLPKGRLPVCVCVCLLAVVAVICCSIHLTQRPSCLALPPG